MIPVYNRAETLIETLDYVLAQSRAPDRLVVVDDGSTDGTPDRIAAWLADRRPSFEWRVIRAEHRFASAARRTGFDAIDDLEVVAFLDSDDHWPVDFLKRGVAVLQEDSSAVAASADRHYLGARVPFHQQSDTRGLADNAVRWLFENGAGVASCTLLRTEAVARAGNWDPAVEIGEDSLFFTHVALEGDWRHLPGEPVVFHLGHAAGRGETGNLSFCYSTNSYTWAEQYEELLDTVCRRQPTLDRRPLTAAVARYWSNAGRDMSRLGDHERATECFARCVALTPRNLQSWRWLARSVVRSRWAAWTERRRAA